MKIKKTIFEEKYKLIRFRNRYDGGYHYFPNNPNIYRISTPLAKIFSNINNEIPIQYFKSFQGYISIPGLDKICEEPLIEGAYLEYCAKYQEVWFVWCGLNGVFSKPAILNTKDLKIFPEFPSEDSEFVTALKIIFNSVLYIKNNCEPFSKEFKSFFPARKALKNKKYSALNNYRVGYNLVNMKYAEECNISGHWRWQPYGKNLSKVKLIWIKPHSRKLIKNGYEMEAKNAS